MEKMYQGWIGTFDSGVGGLTILHELRKLLPEENFYYYGDSLHSPYGEKTREEIIKLSETITDAMVEKGVKALVIACNTATSSAATYLRQKYPNLPIIGVEPALKPAAQKGEDKHVLVMATKATLKLEKFQKLLETFKDQTHVDSVVCTGLASAVERGELHSKEVKDLLHGLLDPYAGKVDRVVLGCTHYPLVKDEIKEILGEVEFYDSSYGTAKQLKNRLREEGLLVNEGRTGQIIFDSSKKTEEELALYKRLYQMMD